MRAVVFAYNNIGCEGIEALLKNGFEIAAVFTHKDDPNENLWFRSVARLAAEKGIPRLRSGKSEPSALDLPNSENETGLSFLLLLPGRSSGRRSWRFPSKGALNLHGSLLPKYRGCAPINWAVINGEKETGVTLHLMTGKSRCRRYRRSEEDRHRRKRHRKGCASQSREGRRRTAPRRTAEAGKGERAASKGKSRMRRRPPISRAANPRTARFDWSKSAAEVRNLVRGVTTPYPGAFSYLGDKKYLIWDVSEVKTPAKAKSVKPGTILSVSSPDRCLRFRRGARQLRAGRERTLLLRRTACEREPHRGENALCVGSFLSPSETEEEHSDSRRERLHRK